jgi:hypothetical protein
METAPADESIETGLIVVTIRMTAGKRLAERAW